MPNEHTRAMPVREQRIMAVYLPLLPTDRIARQKWGRSWRLKPRPDAAPIVIAARDHNAIRIIATEQDGSRYGLSRGMSLSDARALVPTLDVHEQDSRADAGLLHSIAEWCIRYTPLAGIHGDNTLFINITGCAHLFGGEQDMMADIGQRLTAQGFAVQCALAPVPGAAFALALCGKSAIIGREAIGEALAPLPLKALRLPAGTVKALARVGFKTIGCIMDLPRAPLATRFGRDLLLRLDQALGVQDEAINPLLPVAELASEKRFFDPIVHQDDIERTIELLATNMKPLLEQRGLGLLACRLTLFRVDGAVVSLTVSTSQPLREPTRLTVLFRERIASLHDGWDAGFGFDVARLDALQTARFSSEQGDMTQAGNAGEDTYHALVDRLVNRLGEDAVRGFVQHDSHVPERRFTCVPVRQMASAVRLEKTEPDSDIPARPLTIFQHPEPIEVTAEVPDQPPRRFIWRRVAYEVAKADGPERIACEWWLEGRGAHTRDYYRVEDMQGYRFWLFRLGLYERETVTPRWYMHGLFA